MLQYGFGVQIAGSGGFFSLPYSGGGGAELVFYNKASFSAANGLNDANHVSYPYLYIFGNGSLSTDNSFIKTCVNTMKKKLFKLKVKDIINPDITVSVFGVFGDGRFNEAYDYLGVSNAYSATILHVVTSTSSSTDNSILTLGIGGSTSKFAVSASTSIYSMVNPAIMQDMFDDIGNALSSLKDDIINIVN